MNLGLELVDTRCLASACCDDPAFWVIEGLLSWRLVFPSVGGGAAAGTMWLSDVSCTLGADQAHALVATNPLLHSGARYDPQAALFESPDRTMTVPILFLQILVLLLYWYNGRSSVDSYAIRLLINHH